MTESRVYPAKTLMSELKTPPFETTSIAPLATGLFPASKGAGQLLFICGSLIELVKLVMPTKYGVPAVRATVTVSVIMFAGLMSPS